MFWFGAKVRRLLHHRRLIAFFFLTGERFFLDARFDSDFGEVFVFFVGFLFGRCRLRSGSS